ncbi:unnamed protein product [Gadus morhua 'NCC']
MVPCMGNPHWAQDQNPRLVEPGPPPGQEPPPSAAGKTRPSSQTRDRVWAESSVDHELAVHFLSLSRKHWATTHTAPGHDQHTPGRDSNHRALVVALGPTRAEPSRPPNVPERRFKGAGPRSVRAPTGPWSKHLLGAPGWSRSGGSPGARLCKVLSLKKEPSNDSWH